MFSTDIKIISVANRSYHLDVSSSSVSTSTSSSVVDFKEIRKQKQFNRKFNHPNYHKYSNHYNKSGDSLKQDNSKQTRKGNKYPTAGYDRVIWNDSKHQATSNTKNKSIATNNSSNRIINNNTILDNNNLTASINHKLKPTPPLTKSSLTRINDYLNSCSAKQAKENVQDSMVMNNTPKTTQDLTSVATSTAQSPTSPASYTLDFLHSVGVQMTAGTNRAYLTTPSPARHAGHFINANTHRCVGGYSSPEDNAPAGVTSAPTTPSLNGTHPKAGYKDYAAYHTSRNNSIPMPASPAFSYRTAYGYQPSPNYPNHNSRNYGTHIQYHPMSGGNGMNGGHTLNGHNRNHVQKKGWNGINQLNFKTCSNLNMNRYRSVSSSNLGSPQSLARTRNQQNFRNLTYVHTDPGRIMGNSRSPTPSPKSKSPSLYKSHDCGASSLQGNVISEQGHDLLATSAPSIEVTNTNGYESDSSHSSYRPNEYAYCPTSEAVPVSPNFHLGEMPALINMSTLSEDGLKSHAHYYGSHQNLTFWNTAVSSTYRPHSLYSTSGSGSSEAGSQYLDEGNFAQKRSQSSHNNRSFRGRRNIYPNFRAPHTFHENMFTPPDRFLARAHLMEIKENPESLLNGSKWDQVSQMIWEKFMVAQQREETYRKKMYLWRFLYVAIKKAQPRYGLYLVGSTITGFGTDSSDVDMCLVSRSITGLDPRTEAMLNLNRLKDYLESTGISEQMNLIEAKVPILRFRDSMHNFEVDLNFNNCVGIRNTHLLNCYAQLDWRLRPLVVVIKLWAQYHNINNAKNMTISSYSLAQMVIHFLQYAVHPPVLPCLHAMYPEKFQILLMSNDFGFVDMNEEMEPFSSRNSQTVGELMHQFFEYYSNFDYAQYAISIRTGTVLPIEICRQAKTAKNDVRHWKELCIEEPFDLTNTARSVYDSETFRHIKTIIIASWRILQDTMDLNAIFSPIVNPNLSQVPLNIAPTIS